MSLAERIRTLFCEQDIKIISVLTAVCMTISTIVLAITGVFGGGGSVSPPKDEGVLKKMVKKASRCPQKTCWKGC